MLANANTHLAQQRCAFAQVVICAFKDVSLIARVRCEGYTTRDEAHWAREVGDAAVDPSRGPDATHRPKSQFRDPLCDWIEEGTKCDFF